MDVLTQTLLQLENKRDPVSQAKCHILEMMQTVLELGEQLQKKAKTPETLDTFLNKCIQSNTKPKIFQTMASLGSKAEEAKPLFQAAKQAEEKKAAAAAKKAAKATKAATKTTKVQTGGTVETPFGPLTIHVNLPAFSVDGSSTSGPTQRVPIRRKGTIPKSIKEQLWYRYVGNDRTEALCPCCQTETIKIMHFHAGHVISEANGGPTTLENLRPICGRCNLQMGSMNMPDYIWRFYGRRM